MKGWTTLCQPAVSLRSGYEHPDSREPQQAQGAGPADGKCTQYPTGMRNHVGHEGSILVQDPTLKPITSRVSRVVRGTG